MDPLVIVAFRKAPVPSSLQCTPPAMLRIPGGSSAGYHRLARLRTTHDGAVGGDAVAAAELAQAHDAGDELAFEGAVVADRFVVAAFGDPGLRLRLAATRA